MLERKLSKLFDFQRFERNAALQSVIDEVSDKYALGQIVSLKDDDLALAAGGIGAPEKLKKEPDHDGLGRL